MRVISGKARGMKLKAVAGDTTRPILDRAKESLFNILSGFIPGTRWLDLFAGTGQIGIEALSRGAAEVVFTDMAREAVRTIEDNLRHTRLTEGATVLLADAFTFLTRFGHQGGEPFDLIYIAPPQYQELWLKALTAVDAAADKLLADGGLVVVQIDPKEFAEAALTHLVLTDKRKYGRTLFAFYERPEADLGPLGVVDGEDNEAGADGAT